MLRRPPSHWASGCPATSWAWSCWPSHSAAPACCRCGLRSCRISQPIHFLAFVVLQNQYVDAVAGWGLTAVGFAAVAVTLLRTRNDEWDLPSAAPR